ncbi:MAG: 3-hydroxyacyl-ACP dehydratase FabZ [Leptospiraceae bacterium]|nr:3-hydroxyacyl-ACP dehydratase FabZ [Leptospiraceae bacterium]
MPAKLPVKINKIREILPHRYPFLMVDRVIELEENRIVAIKNVSVNEDFFNGHFPVAPIMPGVLQVEALAQTAGLYGPLWDAEAAANSGDKIGVFSKVNNCTFESPVTPGDVLRLEVKITDVEKDNKGNPKRVSAHGEASVDGKITCQCDLEFAMIPAKLISR